MTGVAALEERIRGGLDTEGGPEEGALVAVAVSGGLDSCVLLHALRFGLPGRLDLVAAHYDHGLRPESAADAAWVRGLCRAWGVPLRLGHGGAGARSEDAARRARYDFLEDAGREIGARAILTAHHADDQAETVLFRVLRGTGIAGLAGIPLSREPGVLRPMLEVWRSELEEYAALHRISWRDDASNDEISFARNALRHRILPDSERLVAPAARRALVRLARIAAADEAAWESVLDGVLDGLGVERGGGRVALARSSLLSLHPGVRARVLRALAGELGSTLDEEGTRIAVEFSGSGRSGGRVDLGAGVALGRSLDRLVLSGPSRPSEDRPLVIPDRAAGAGVARIGDRDLAVSWGPSEGVGHAWAATLKVADDAFPLVVRGREPGDRIRLAGGTKKLKKLLLEARIPHDERARVPVVADASGRVRWVAGVAVEGDSEGDGVDLWIGMAR